MGRIRTSGGALILLGLAACRAPAPAISEPPVQLPAPPACPALPPQVPPDALRVDGGIFWQGCLDARGARGCRARGERPGRRVDVAPFRIGRTEVCNVDYGAFLAARGNNRCGSGFCVDASVQELRLDAEGGWRAEAGWEERPVVEVTWAGADAYCRAMGGTLPTVKQWQRAARGDDRRTYPWGNQPPDCERALFGPCEGVPRPVGEGSAGASACGALHMGGNVWEWLQPGPEARPGEAPIAGGGVGSPAQTLRVSHRSTEEVERTHHYLGFRCVWPPEAEHQ